MAKSHCQIVKKIIDDVINDRGFVYKTYVLEMIKNRIDPQHLLNATLGLQKNTGGLEHKKSTGDGIENMRIGAQKVFKDSMRWLKAYYVSDGEMIVRAELESNSRASESEKELLLYKGKLWSMKELADEAGINLYAFRLRIRRGWSVERAMTQPQQKAKPKIFSRQYLRDTIRSCVSGKWTKLEAVRKKCLDLIPDEVAEKRYAMCFRRYANYAAKSGHVRVLIADPAKRIATGRKMYFTATLRDCKDFLERSPCRKFLRLTA